MERFPAEELEEERRPPAPDERLETAQRSLGFDSSAPADERQRAAHSEGRGHHAVSTSLDLSDKLLLEMSAAFSNLEQCISLAVKLKLGENEVFKLLDVTFDDQLAYNVIKKWMKVHEEQATGLVLHAALLDIERHDLADQFEARLFGRDGQDESETELGNDRELPSELSESSEVIPSIELLYQIANYLPKQKHCERLARSLGLGKDFIKRLGEGSFNPSTSALNILRTWRQKKSMQATGKVLFDALVAINKRDVAACFAGELLGEDVDWEDCVYDDDHRDLFRLLRRKGLDVSAVYERMHCSEDFISRLRQRSILTDPEYDALISLVQMLGVRSEINKPLIDVINKKLPQVQEMFAEQLCHHQGQLVMVDGDTAVLFDSVCQGQDKDAAESVCASLGQALLTDFQEELGRFFNQLLIVRPIDFVPSEYFQPVSEMYVTLSSISYEEALQLIGSPQQLRGSQLLNAASRVDAESKHSQELGNLHSLLGSHQGAQPQRTLLFGSAGSGKSLTMLKILSEWIAKDSASPFKRFDAIVYITGRERSRLSTMDVNDLWRIKYLGYTEQQEEFLLDHFSRHSDKVLFLIDGWDECWDDNLLREDTVMKQILCGDLFPQSAVIITSRPAPNAYPLLEKCKHRYALVGFSDRRLQELFNRRLGEQKASNLFHTLSQSSHLHVKAAVQKTPLFAALVAELYQMDEAVPLTITALYQLMLDSIRSRYVEWVKEMRTSGGSEMLMFDGKPAKTAFDEAVRNLSKVALVGLMSKKVTFSKDDVMSCGEDVIQQRFGLLSEMREIGNHEDVTLYYFSHATWQEFLAAVSLAGDPDFINNLPLCVSCLGVGEHTHMFWRFLAGLVSSQLLADLVFELMKASGVSGQSPWETEVRLFLMECVAENVRMRQMQSDSFCPDVYVQLAAQMIFSVSSGTSVLLNGCILDTNHLLSLAVVMKVCPNIISFTVVRCQIEEHCPAPLHAFEHMTTVEFVDVLGTQSSVFLQTVISSLRSSRAITEIHCSGVKVTAESMASFGQLINDSLSLKTLGFEKCRIGSAGLVSLSKSMSHSSSSLNLYFRGDSFPGTGCFLKKLCSGLPQLEQLYVESCGLDNKDFADILTGLQNNPNIKIIDLSGNQLTDEFAAPLLQFAAWRNHVYEQLRAPFCACNLQVHGNIISEDVVYTFAHLLPAKCNIYITYGQKVTAHLQIQAVDHAGQLLCASQASADGNISCSRGSIGENGGTQVAQFLKTSYGSHLRSLDLSCNAIGDNGVSAIAEALPRCKLQGLDLSRNQLSFVGFHKLMCALSMGSSLEYLNIGQNPLFANCLVPSGQMTPSILTLSLSVHSLNILSVNSTSFNDESWAAENSLLALMVIPSLCVLDLSENGITDKSVHLVSEYMCNLEYLSLSGNRISSDGGKALISKTERLLEDVETNDQSSCRLVRVWLGGNNIDQSVLTDCCCKIISSGSFSIQRVEPKFVRDMFSSAVISSSPESCARAPSHMCRPNEFSPFFKRMKVILMSKVFGNVMAGITKERDTANFERWWMRGVHAAAHHDDSENPVKAVRQLLKLFWYLSNWYMQVRAFECALAVCCCSICIVDELMVTSSLFELEYQAERILSTIIVQLCSLDIDYLRLMVQFMSGLAERCHRRQLHSVAECILQQMEYVCQQVYQRIL